MTVSTSSFFLSILDVKLVRMEMLELAFSIAFSKQWYRSRNSREQYTGFNSLKGIRIHHDRTLKNTMHLLIVRGCLHGKVEQAFLENSSKANTYHSLSM